MYFLHDFRFDSRCGGMGISRGCVWSETDPADLPGICSRRQCTCKHISQLDHVDVIAVLSYDIVSSSHFTPFHTPLEKT